MIILPKYFATIHDHAKISNVIPVLHVRTMILSILAAKIVTTIFI